MYGPKQGQGARFDPVMLLNLGPFHGQLSNVAKFYTPRSYARTASYMESMLNAGALQSAQGRQNWFIMPNGVNCMGMGRLYITGSSPQIVVAGDDGNIYWATDSQGPAYLLNSGQKFAAPATWTHPANTAYFVQYGSFMFVSNGVDPPFKFDSGHSSTSVGIAGPTTACTLADGGAGNLSAGTYTYVYTYQTGTQESSPLAATLAPSITLAAGHQVNLSAVADPPGGSGATAKNIYRQGGNNQFYNFVAQLAIGVTTYTDNNSDTTVAPNKVLYTTEVYGGAQQAFADPPLNLQKIIQSNNVLMGIRPATDASVNSPNNFDYLSNPVMPEGWNVNNKIAFGPNDGDSIQTATTMGEMPVFPKSASTWGLGGTQAADFTPKRLFNVGTLSALSVVETDIGLTFLAPYGWMVWPGEGRPIILSDRINTDIQNLPLATRQGAVGAYVPSMASVFLSFPAASLTYQVNLSTGDVFQWPFAFNQALTVCQAGDPYTMYALRTSDTTKIDRWFSQNADLGSPFSPTLNWISDRMIVGDPRWVHILTQLEVVFDEASSDFTITVTCDNNSKAAQIINVPVGQCQFKGANAYYTVPLSASMQATDVTIQVVGSRSDVLTKVYAIMLWGYQDHERLNP